MNHKKIDQYKGILNECIINKTTINELDLYNMLHDILEDLRKLESVKRI